MSYTIPNSDLSKSQNQIIFMYMLRCLTKSDFQAYSSLRSYGLVTDPSSFWASEEEELPIRKHRFEKLVDDPFDFILGHFHSGNLVSIAGFKREENLKLKHKGTIWGVYTHPEFRGQGLAKLLLLDVIRTAFEYEGINQVNLSTNTKNTKAIKLYKAMGFQEFGVEKQCSLINGQFYDEMYMVKFRNQQ